VTAGAAGVRVRPAVEADRGFITGLVPRLRAFGPPPLRPPDAMDRAEVEALERALSEPAPDAALLVAELDGVGPAGVALANTATDYFTHERHGHLSIIIVSDQGEGRGVGRALLEAVERWSADQGHRFITLNVFSGNQRAHAPSTRAPAGGRTPCAT
jgi:GNAT superfamily N-acetyltransferase